MSGTTILAVLALAAPQGGFVERAEELGLDHVHAAGLDRVGIGTEMLDWAQCGIALGDVDGDGGLDAVCAGGLLPSRLFLRAGVGWVDATAGSGIETREHDRAPALGDYDADGDLDLFLGALDPGDGPVPPRGRLYRGDGDGTFEDVTALSGTVGNGHTIHARWVDVDRDGLLDLLTAEFHGTPNRLYLNHGDGTFAEVSQAWGFDDAGSAHAVGVVDSDGDGWLDAFVGNDFLVSSSMDLTSNAANAHLAGLPGGAFADVSLGSGYGLKLTTMAVAFGDVDYDGDQDVYQTEFGANFLLENRGWPGSGQPWSDVASSLGVEDEVTPYTPQGATGKAVGWGAALRHLDLDPWLDLVVVNGHVSGQDPTNQRNTVYRGLGPQAGFAFEDATLAWSFDDYVDDRALAVGDPDLDGDLDLFVGGVTSRLRYFENRLERDGQGWLRVEPVCRTSAPGGQDVEVSWTDAEGLPHVRVVGADAPTASQNEYVANFGLGEESAVDVRVAFPSGIALDVPDVPRDTVLVAEEPRLFELPFRTARVSPDGETFVVAAFAHDASGQELGADALVEIEVEGLQPAGDVVHAGGSRYERAFVVPAQPGAHRVTARFDGFEVRVRPRLLFAKKLGERSSRARISPSALRAGTDDAATLTVAPRSRLGTALGPGLRVLALVAGQELALTDLGDGRYSAPLAAPAEPGAWPVDVRVVVPGGGSAELPDLIRLEAAGPAVQLAADLEIPDPDIAAEPNRLKGRVTPLDADGRRLGPGADVVLEVVPLPSSAPVVLLPSPGHVQDDGDVVFVLETGSPGDARGELRVRVDGVELEPVPFAF